MSLHDKRTPITIIFSSPLVYYVCGWSLAISRKRVLPEHCSQIWWGGIKWPRRPLDYSAVSFLLLGIWKKAFPVKSKFFLPTVASCLLSCVLSLPYSMCSRQIWDVHVQLCDAFMSIWPKNRRNISRTLLNLCQDELSRIWKLEDPTKGVLNKVVAECVSLKLSVYFAETSSKIAKWSKIFRVGISRVTYGKLLLFSLLELLFLRG